MPSVTRPAPFDAEALNDRLAREHPIDDYYAKLPLPLRWIENERLRIIREMVGPSSGLDIAAPRGATSDAPCMSSMADIDGTVLGPAVRPLVGACSGTSGATLGSFTSKEGLRTTRSYSETMFTRSRNTALIVSCQLQSESG